MAMTVSTMFVQNHGKAQPLAHQDPPSLTGLAMRFFKVLRSHFLAFASGTLSKSGRRMVVDPVAGRELDAIRTFADFIAKNPDMPADQRKWFLAKIQTSCEELREELS